LVSLFSGGELILANVAELTGEIFGKIFPLDALLFFVVDPAANVTDIFHGVFLLLYFNDRIPHSTADYTVRVLYGERDTLPLWCFGN